jgi:general secretion pathway protein G
MWAKYKEKHKTQSGFTIVELLIVIIVIAILATLTIVAYNGIQQKAIVSTLKSDLSSAHKQLSLYEATYGSFPTALDANYCPTVPSQDSGRCLEASNGNTFSYTSDGITFSLTETSANSTAYNVTNSTEITAVVVIQTFKLTITAGTNGTVNSTVNGDYQTGASISITATPNANYIFSSWSGNTGCVGTASHTITMDEAKTCTASFVADPWANWYPGIAATVLAGKHVYKTDLASTYMYKPTTDTVAAPQGVAGLDPNYPTYLSLVSPQANPGVSFSSYPAQNACKTIGGRLANTQELSAMYTGRASYGSNFLASYYWSSTQYFANYAYYITFNNGSIVSDFKNLSGHIRCIAD